MAGASQEPPNPNGGQSPRPAAGSGDRGVSPGRVVIKGGLRG